MTCGWLDPLIHMAMLVCGSKDSELVRRHHLYHCGGGIVTNSSCTVAVDKCRLTTGPRLVVWLSSTHQQGHECVVFKAT